MRNILSVDVEEYFHPSEVQRYVDPAGWDKLPTRIELQTRRVLDLLDRHQAKATFFVLGWVARRQPGLLKEILARGHEIGCHGYSHRLVEELGPEGFREDLRAGATAIADACGVMPRVYRAPSYSITARTFWALEALAEAGFTHDSSIYPIRHDRYGMPEFGRQARRIQTASGEILEVPVATVRLSRGRVAPVGGGAYLRLLPYRYTAAGIRRLNREDRMPACIYFHPWELDPGQPRLISGRLSAIRTYFGLGRMESKLQRLLTEFRFSTLTAVYPGNDIRSTPTSD